VRSCLQLPSISLPHLVSRRPLWRKELRFLSQVLPSWIRSFVELPFFPTRKYFHCDPTNWHAAFSKPTYKISAGSTITQLFIYIFTNSKKHFTPTNQQNTRNATLRQCELAADTPPQSGEKYRKSLLGTGNSLMMLDTFADSGRKEGNNWNSDI